MNRLTMLIVALAVLAGGCGSKTPTTPSNANVVK